MRSKTKRQGSKMEHKTPTSTWVAVLTAIMTGLGTIASHWQENTSMRIEMAAMKQDIAWIKAKLTADGQRVPDSQRALSKP